MSTRPGTIEQRQFGRRTARAHAWIHVEGRTRIPCVVTNYSPDGAKLTFDPATNGPMTFWRVVEGVKAEIPCEVRQGRVGVVGVQFLKDERARNARAAPNVDELLDWLAK